MTILNIQKSDLNKMYLDERAPIKKIASYYDVSTTTILNRMRLWDIKSRPSNLPNQTRRRNINDIFFKNWNEESAWLYGWAIGDGNFTGKYSLRFGLQRQDKIILERFKNILNSEHPITDYISSNCYKSAMSSVQFCSQTLVDDIKHLDITEINNKYFMHFVRGFFEADGSVILDRYKNRIKIGGIAVKFSQKKDEILKFLRDKLLNLGITLKGRLNFYKQDSRKNGMWELRYYTHDSLALYDYFYANCGELFLPRKKEKFEMLINMTRA